MKDLVGVKIDRYEIQAKIGEGGMAMVYRAYDARLKRDVAIKLIHASNAQQERFYKRFEREVRAMAVLTHPGIVQIYDVGDYNGLPYLVMEYLPGGTLKRYLGRPMAWQEAVSMLLSISDALSFAHKQGIIHRDVKPSNILLDGMGRTRLSDFGIAKFMDQKETMELTGTNLGIGTPEYMAPEQGLGQNLDERADIYALATVCFELVTGQKPFKGNEALAILVRKINEPPPHAVDLLHGLPDALDQTLYKAMASKPDARHATMASFSTSLSSLLGKSNSSVSPENMDAEFEDQATKDFDLLSPESLELVLGEYREKLEEMKASIPALQEQVQEAVASKDWGKVQEISEKIKVCENSQATYQEMIARLSLISELHEQGDSAIQSGNWDAIDTVIVRLGELGQTGERYAKLLKRDAARAQQDEVDRIAQQVSSAIQKKEWQTVEAGLAGLNDLGATAEKTYENLQANYQSARQAEEQQRKEIHRLSGFASDALRDEDWGKAEAALKALNGLGADGQKAAQPLLKQYEAQHKQAEKQETQIRELFAKVQTAAEAEDWTQAEAGLSDLRQLNARGLTARIDQLAVEVEAKQASAIQQEREQVEAALAAEQQKAEIEELSIVIKDAIDSEEWNLAKSGLTRLEKLGVMRGEKARKFRQQFSNSREAAQVREEAARSVQEAVSDESKIINGEQVEAELEQVESNEGVSQPGKKNFSAFARAGLAIVMGVLVVGAGMVLLRNDNAPAMVAGELPAVTVVVDKVTGIATYVPTQTEMPVPTVTVAEVATETPIPSPTPISKVSEKDGMEMVYVPAGEFIMGSDEGNDDERPENVVYLDAYWIDKYEVTNSQYAHCVEVGLCSEPGKSESFEDPAFKNYPVTFVNWNDAMNYCSWVGRKLPSEAEWEKAARGVDGRSYPWGEEKPSQKLLNFDSNMDGPTVIGSYLAGISPYGVHDMAGNVLEWTADWYDEGYYLNLQTSNPKGPSYGVDKVLRGGSWTYNESSVRSYRRHYFSQTEAFYYFGFRCGESASSNEINQYSIVDPKPTFTPMMTSSPTSAPLVGSPKVSEIDGMEMVYVPAGEFIMGSDEGEDDEKPVHNVYLDAYWIDKYEVTNAQYQACIEAGACDRTIATNFIEYFPNRSVVWVSWYNANDYCTWAGRRLPSEAEWEKAARGADGRIYPWGNEPPDSTLLSYYGEMRAATDVGSYPAGASPYGAMDMVGNVWEWVADWYSWNYYGSQSIWKNPIGPLDGEGKALRGGSWASNKIQVRVTNRKDSDPAYGVGPDGGFRCAVSAAGN